MALWTAMLCFAAGGVVGWLLRYAWAEDRFARALSRYEPEASQSLNLESNLREADAAIISADVETDLALLIQLDCGALQEARTVLICKLGLFYQEWGCKPQTDLPRPIQGALMSIREAAKSYESVRTVLNYKRADEFGIT